MGFIKKLFKTTAYGGAGAAASWLYLTRNSKFVPLSASDPIFNSAAYRRNNPNHNPATQDLCVRRVPLQDIKPDLLEKDGKLVEAFCAGVWGGLGMSVSVLAAIDNVAKIIGNRLRVSTKLPCKEIPEQNHNRASALGNRRTSVLRLQIRDRDHRSLRGCGQEQLLDCCPLRRFSPEKGRQRQ